MPEPTNAKTPEAIVKNGLEEIARALWKVTQALDDETAVNMSIAIAATGRDAFEVLIAAAGFTVAQSNALAAQLKEKASNGES